MYSIVSIFWEIFNPQKECEMISGKWFRLSVAVPAALLLAGCASSERMVRMSGVLGSYEKPRSERVAGFSATAARNELPALDDSLINLWPFFYRNNLYTSILWPMIDSDPYGFAVRPFFNQEGNEYSILFPLCAWNPVNGDGWLANVSWNRDGFGAVPLFYHPWNPEALACYTLFWKWGDSWGVFPVARFGEGIRYVAPLWWYHGEKHSSGGLFPVARFSTLKSSPSYFGPFWLWKDDFGLFPVVRCSPGKLSYVGPFWRDAADRSFGVFPVFNYRNALNHFLLPLYSISRDGKRFLSPLAAWDDNGMFSILGPVYIRSGKVFRNEPGINPMFSSRGRVAERSFRMFGLLGYAGNRAVFDWKNECRLNGLNAAKMEAVRKNRAYLLYQLEKLGYRGKFPETDEELLQLKQALTAYTEKRQENYFGLVPLFHWESSPSEQIFRFLLFLPYYRSGVRRGQELAFLGPFLFRWRGAGEPDSLRRISALERDLPLGHSSLFSLPLLGGIWLEHRYAASPEREILRKLIADSRAAEGRIDRRKVGAELRKLNPELTLPESVTDGESLRAFLADTAAACDLPTRTEWSGGTLPLFFRTEENAWIFPALLSGYQISDDRKVVFSLPLLTLLREGREERIRNLLFPVGWMESDTRNDRDTAYVCEADEILDNRSPVRESGVGILLRLYYRNEDRVLVAVRRGEAKQLNRLRDELRIRIFRLRELRRMERKIATLRPHLEREMAQQAGKTVELKGADACRDAVSAAPSTGYLMFNLKQLEQRYRDVENLREMLASSRNELSTLFAALEIPAEKFNLEEEKELQTCMESLYGERIRECTVRSTGSWFARYKSTENASRWDIGWILAEGSTSGDREELRILRYLYRYRRSGSRSETLLPFFSLQEEGKNRRVSFFWRLWESRTVDGKSSGHICFIPFGEQE